MAITHEMLLLFAKKMAANNTQDANTDKRGGQQQPTNNEVDVDDIDDKHWDELSPPLQTAAAKLGYSQKLWDDDQEPEQSDRNWIELTSEQREAAGLLGYTQVTWDEDIYIELPALEESFDDSSGSDEGATVDVAAQTASEDDDRGGGEELLENRIRGLREEIAQRQRKLKRLLAKKEGSAYASMLMRNEDHVNSHLEKRLADSHSKSSTQHENNQFLPAIDHEGGGPLKLLLDFFLNEYYHTLPGCVSMSIHSALYITIYGIVSTLTKPLCSYTTSWFSTSWHIIDSNYDDSREENIFFLALLLFSFALARVTGALYDWNENRSYQRRIKFHVRNRWYLGCWDVRLMNWFGGDDIGGMHSRHHAGEASSGSGTEAGDKAGSNDKRKNKKWGPRVKKVLDVISFYLCYCCIEWFIKETISDMVIDRRDAVLEGLPSRQLKLQQEQQRQWTDNMTTQDSEELFCISGDGDGGGGLCSNHMVDPEKEFMSDILNWALNSNRCGWVRDGDDDDDEDDSSDDEEDPLESCPNCYHQKLDNKSSIVIPLSEVNYNPRTPKVFKPWKQGSSGDGEDWETKMNLRDDEYLRANISMDAYFAFVGDPFATFIDPVEEQYYMMVVMTGSFVLLHWLEAPFLLL